MQCFFFSTWLGSDLGHLEHIDIIYALIRRRHMPRPVFSDGRKAMVLTVDHGFLCGGDELGCAICNKADSFCDGNPCYFKPRESSCCFCFCLLLPPAAGFAAFCCLLAVAACCGVGAPTHIVGPHTRYTKRTAAAMAHRNLCVCCFFSRCCSSAASHMALQALHLWHLRCCCSRAVSPLLCDSHGRRLCVCVCVRLCVTTS